MSKIYAYSVRLRRNLAKNLKELCICVEKKKINKRNNKKRRLGTDLKFQQNKIKKLNETFSVDMFPTKIRGGKAFGAEQNICKLKEGISKLKGIRSKSKVIMRAMLIKKL